MKLIPFRAAMSLVPDARYNTQDAIASLVNFHGMWTNENNSFESKTY